MTKQTNLESRKMYDSLKIVNLEKPLREGKTPARIQNRVATPARILAGIAIAYLKTLFN